MTDDPLAGRRVLVVEDEALIAMLLEDMLADLGCVVVGVAATLDEALAQAATVECDIAVLDVNLAGRTSLPAADLIAARGIPVVFATGYGRDGPGSAARPAPVIQKPFDSRTLGGALRAALAPAAPG